MANAVPAVLVLALACLFALSTALPSVLNQIMYPKTEPNAPRTLLGKPYRRCSDGQRCSPSCWIRPLTNRNDDCIKAGVTVESRAQLPFPLVLNAYPESEPARLRLMRSKRPWRYSPGSDGTRLSHQAGSDRTTPKDEHAQGVQLPVVAGPGGGTESSKVSVPVRRLNRLSSRGEWKSRLLEEY
ncbi:hypothetical protein V8E55_012037 [Tylopilus felleus]